MAVPLGMAAWGLISSAGGATVRFIGSAVLKGTVRGLPVAGKTASRILTNKYVTGISQASLIGAQATEYFTDEDLMSEEVEEALMDLSSLLLLSESILWLKESNVGNVVGGILAARRGNFRKFVKSFPRPQGVISKTRGRRPADMTKTWDKAFDTKSKTWTVHDGGGNALILMNEKGVAVSNFHKKRLGKVKFVGGTAAAAAAMFELTDDETLATVNEYLDFLVNTIFESEEIQSGNESSDEDDLESLSLQYMLTHPDSVYTRLSYMMDLPRDHHLIEKAVGALLLNAMQGGRSSGKIDLYNSDDVAKLTIKQPASDDNSESAVVVSYARPSSSGNKGDKDDAKDQSANDDDSGAGFLNAFGLGG